MPTILQAVGLSVPDSLDGRSFAPLLFGKGYEERSYIFTTYYQIFAKIRYPMRSVQNKEYGYIYNFWSDGEKQMRGDAMGGLTWRAMVKAAGTDSAIAKRVKLYRYRVPEEFYDLKKDPDGLNNLIDNPAYFEKIEQFRELMLKQMIKYNDYAYEAYRDRDKAGAIEDFMKKQHEKAGNTKSNVLF